MVAKRKVATKTKKTATTKKVEEVKKPKQSPKNIELDSETKSAIIEEVAKAMKAEIEGKVQVAIQQILKASESRTASKMVTITARPRLINALR